MCVMAELGSRGALDLDVTSKPEQVSECAAIFLGLTPACRALDVDSTILLIIREMSQLSSVLKVWRGVVSEIVNDNRFFGCSPENEVGFRPIVQAWIKADKSALAEVVGS